MRVSMTGKRIFLTPRANLMLLIDDICLLLARNYDDAIHNLVVSADRPMWLLGHQSDYKGGDW